MRVTAIFSPPRAARGSTVTGQGALSFKSAGVPAASFPKRKSSPQNTALAGMREKRSLKKSSAGVSRNFPSRICSSAKEKPRARKISSRSGRGKSSPPLPPESAVSPTGRPVFFAAESKLPWPLWKPSNPPKSRAQGLPFAPSSKYFSITSFRGGAPRPPRGRARKSPPPSKFYTARPPARRGAARPESSVYPPP